MDKIFLDENCRAPGVNILPINVSKIIVSYILLMRRVHDDCLKEYLIGNLDGLKKPDKALFFLDKSINIGNTIPWQAPVGGAAERLKARGEFSLDEGVSTGWKTKAFVKPMKMPALDSIQAIVFPSIGGQWKVI